MVPRIMNSWCEFVDDGFTILDEKTREKILGIDGSKIYWYGKKVRRRRKVGHINLIGDDQSDLDSKIQTVREILYGDHINDFF